MSRSELLEHLPELKRELEEIKNQISQLQQEGMALSEVIRGLERLSGKQLLLAGEAGHGSDHASVVVEATPRGKDAVRALLFDGRNWELPAIVAEVKRKGWIKAGASRPDEAIRQSVRRLVEAGEVERVGNAYRLAPEQFGQIIDETVGDEDK